MNKEINEMIEKNRQLRQDMKNLRKEVRDEQTRQWKSITEKYDGVYVFRSELDPSIPMNGDKIRKVTVVGLVKKEDDGTFTLSVAWSKCHEKDTFNRKTGNLIAANRADNPDATFEFNNFEVRPMVFKNFATGRIKDSFITIATMIIDLYEDLYIPSTKDTLKTIDVFGSLTLEHQLED